MPMHYCRRTVITGNFEYSHVPRKTIVEPPITDPPRSGQPPYNGHTPCYGMKLLSTSEKRTLLDSGQRTRATLPTALSNTKLPLNNGHPGNHTPKIAQ